MELLIMQFFALSRPAILIMPSDNLILTKV